MFGQGLSGAIGCGVSGNTTAGGFQFMGGAGEGRWRGLVDRVGFVRSGYYLMSALKEAVMDNHSRGQAEMDQAFQPREDPWGYTTDSYQKARISSELAMLDAVRRGQRFGKVMEIGCAEGIFTELLASRCDALLAVDLSRVALERARRRLSGSNRVQLAEWDLRLDPVPGAYDLIVVIHALEYIRNPLTARKVREKLVGGLRPGGHLLVGTMTGGAIHQSAWWGRYFLRSGRRINEFYARHAGLRVVETAEFDLGPGFMAYDVFLQKAA
jgi:SAM-dependent methyltransferase